MSVEPLFGVELRLRMAIQEETRRLESQNARHSVSKRYPRKRVRDQLTSGKLQRLTKSLELILKLGQTVRPSGTEPPVLQDR